METVVETKVCIGCKEEKSLDEFYKTTEKRWKTVKTRPMSRCKICHNEMAMKNYEGDKENRLAKGKEWKRNNRDKANGYKNEWIKKNPLARKEHKRRSMIKMRHGITWKQYDEMKNKQQGKCLICKKETKLVIDHKHTDADVVSITGKRKHPPETIRGLLCDPCNRGLGCFRDNLQALENAIDYLKGN